LPTIALAGDTMLGRSVAEALETDSTPVLAPEVVAMAGEADLFVLNLECCISARGERWPDRRKPFFFRAPPQAAELLAGFGVDCVTLANNHTLDFGAVALADTLAHLDAAGVAWVGAGATVAEAQRPRVLAAGGDRLAVVAFSDHPRAYAATEDGPGIAYAELGRPAIPEWLDGSIRELSASQPTLVLAHWGPNMTGAPVASVRAAASALRHAGAAFVAGHSAHVVHGVADRVAYDLGDFVDDYAVDAAMRNDLGFLWLVTLDAAGPRRLEALPLELGYARTDVARGDDATLALGRLQARCAALGTAVEIEAGRAVIRW
jgi:poly-gamma-glutamate capsule biosynthesis protein CapA/YwtB (metallophosphatase superfamily)